MHARTQGHFCDRSVCTKVGLVALRTNTLTVISTLQVESRAALASAWQREPDWLLRELTMWLRPGRQAALQDIWSQLQQESTSPRQHTAKRTRKNSQ